MHICYQECVTGTTCDVAAGICKCEPECKTGTTCDVASGECVSTTAGMNLPHAATARED
jgi:hypothetical protein